MITFSNPVGLYFLIALGALILFYLFARRPVKKAFTSLMFFMKDQRMQKQRASWRRIMTNLLFFLQLLALLAAALAIALPSFEHTLQAHQDHAIIIMDTSASMQAAYKGETRFEHAIDEAIKQVQGRKEVSIILAESIPIIALQKGSVEAATTVLRDLQPSDGTTALGDAMLQALLLDTAATVIILSDFASFEGTDPALARQQLRQKGMSVLFLPFTEAVKNVGIVDLKVLGDEAEVKIKNFQSQGIRFTLRANTTEKEVTIAEKSISKQTIPLVEGQNIVELVVKDDFAPDNHAFIVVPEREKVNTLFITNKEGPDFLETALESLGVVNIQKTALPIVPEESFPLYIIKDIDVQKVLPTTFEELYRKAKEGSVIIMHVQSNADEINMEKLRFADLTKVEQPTETIVVEKNSVTANVNVGSLQHYFATANAECTPWVVTPEEHVIMCKKQVEKGALIWFGIPEEASAFKNTPDYPLFWNYLLLSLFPQEVPEQVHHEAGALLPIPEQTVQTPQGTINTARLVMKKAGFYAWGENVRAANMINQEESNVNTQIVLPENVVIAQESKANKEKRPFAKPLIMVALLCLVIELFLLKWRGDC